MRELVGGKNTIGRTAAVLKKPHKVTFNLFFTAVSLYRSLDLAPNIVLHSRRTAPLYEACESV